MRIKYIVLTLISFVLLLSSCKESDDHLNEINIGYIGPLTGNAQDLGEGPAKAMKLAVDQYNRNRLYNQPKVNLYVENDFWEGKNAIPLYDKLRKEHQIKILFISHSDGTIALQEKILKDQVVLINSLNNDDLLSKMNKNTFKIGKKTEEAAKVIAARIIELGKKNITGFHVNNSFMTIFANVVKKEIEKQGIKSDIRSVDVNKTDYISEIKEFKEKGTDGMVFFGYKNLGFAMKQTRELGITVTFYGSTTTLGEGFYENSNGTIEGTEMSFFTPNDGNYVLATKFLREYEEKYNEMPLSIWPPLQAYDAMNIVLSIIKTNNREHGEKKVDWMKRNLYATDFYQGVCGNIAILKDGSSRGIYFSLYNIIGKGEIEKVKR